MGAVDAVAFSDHLHSRPLDDFRSRIPIFPMMAGTKELFNEQYGTGGRGSHRLGFTSYCWWCKTLEKDLDEFGDWAKKKDM